MSKRQLLEEAKARAEVRANELISGDNKSKKRKADTGDIKTTVQSSSNDNKKAKLSADLRPLTRNSSKVGNKKNNSAEDTNATNIIYLGHIPQGFYENEIRRFFSQFGVVKRIKLFRSPRTNNSKGYAFIEFDTNETAAVVAESINGYLLAERKLVAHVIPKDQLHRGMFVTVKKKDMNKNDEDSEASNDGDDEEGSENEKDAAESDEESVEEEVPMDDERFEKLCKEHLDKMKSKQRALKALGIEYVLPFAQPVEQRVLAMMAPVAPTKAEATNNTEKKTKPKKKK